MDDVQAAMPADDARPPGAARVIVLMFVAILLDGFDAASLALAVPALSRAWDTEPAAFTLPLVITNAGVVAGYLGSGAAAARFGSRRLLIGAVLLFGLGSIASALVLDLHSIGWLAVTRVVTGLGLGAVLPVAVSHATTFAPARHRTPISVGVTLGLATGSAVAGLFGRTMIERFGVAGVFWIAGLAPVVLAIVMAIGLPSLPSSSGARADHEQRAALPRLFEPEWRGSTLVLWVYAFLVFFSSYVLLSWTPTFLLRAGFTPAEAPIGLAWLSLGGVVGGMLLMFASARFGIMASLVGTATVGAVCLLVASLATPGRTALLWLIGGAGAGVIASQIGQLIAAVNLYPASIRITGVGWAAALGRMGAIVGPAIVGALMALKLDAGGILLVDAVPMVIAIFCALMLWVGTRRRAMAARNATAAPAA